MPAENKDKIINVLGKSSDESKIASILSNLVIRSHKTNAKYRTKNAKIVNASHFNNLKLELVLV